MPKFLYVTVLKKIVSGAGFFSQMRPVPVFIQCNATMSETPCADESSSKPQGNAHGPRSFSGIIPCVWNLQTRNRFPGVIKKPPGTGRSLVHRIGDFFLLERRILSE
jgi:hypothetical protein